MPTIPSEGSPEVSERAAPVEAAAPSIAGPVSSDDSSLRSAGAARSAGAPIQALPAASSASTSSDGPATETGFAAADSPSARGSAAFSAASDLSATGSGGASSAAGSPAAADPLASAPLEVVLGTVDRAVLRSVQTPQGFRHEVLAAAHAAAIDPLTDDAGLVEKAGLPVSCVPGSELAMKITRPLDLILAEALLHVR
ncbi:2-C-methyl-D-erythritol 4-phosphate cytidylyltransferase [Actinoplanes sp. TBRC 11911]|uniref:2-C-methyl-D-erythritol 4-phosphate cytidylyltransferase n=1 Tax=Actinoplanes sp. TBRC 11911 TaxID=2729386 RepID=UPI0037BF8164